MYAVALWSTLNIMRVKHNGLPLLWFNGAHYVPTFWNIMAQVDHIMFGYGQLLPLGT
jgi:hypothetical protein